MFEEKVILVVDDEMDLREILRDELVFEGANVTEAANGKEAFEKFSAQKYDAVLSDIRMPGGDGVTLAQKIRSVDRLHPVIILITGFADLGSEEAYALGADGYMTKPFHLEELKETLARLLLPSEQRWTEHHKLEVQKIWTSTETLPDMVREGRAHMGRGGLFLQIVFDQLRVGEVLEVHFPHLDPILTKVRWIRSETVDSQKPGLGLEFLSMSPQALSDLEAAFPNWKNSLSFIPRN